MKIKFFLLSVFTLLIFSSCDNEDVDDIFQLQPEDLIAENSELFGLLERVTEDPDSDERPITCIRFIYNFTVVIYSENSELERTEVVSSDSQFSELLGSVGEGSFVGISFPITSQLPDGTLFEVNNKDELKEAIDACVEEEQEETVSYCEGIFQTCVWEVQLPADATGFDTYENAVFSVNTDGTIDFFHRGVIHDGTWIVYFIEDELHININIDDDFPDDAYSTDLDWNFDWKTTIIDAQTMEISTDSGKKYLLKQRCDEEEYCTTLRFTACEDTPDSQIAQFVLETYESCIAIIASPEPVDENTNEENAITYDFTFYVTMADAENTTNPLDKTAPYTNVNNPEEIFVRVENSITQEFIIVTITLVAVSCP